MMIRKDDNMNLPSTPLSFPKLTYIEETPHTIISLLKAIKACKSNSEAKRKVFQNLVKINDVIVEKECIFDPLMTEDEELNPFDISGWKITVGTQDYIIEYL